MEIPVIGSSQVNLGRAIDVGFCNFGKNLNCTIFNIKNNSKTCNIFQSQSFKWESKSAIRFTLKASATSQTDAAVISEKGSINSRNKPTDGLKLYVGLPLDAVSNCNTVSHARAISAGLKALKLLGVDGVELPVWWGIAEKEESGKYDWTGYLVLAEMVQKLGLKLHVSLCFHASKDAKIPLPSWVSRIGDSQPDIYFKDRSGRRFKDCLSLAVDDLPVLDGKTPIEAYTEFLESFKASFSPFFGSTITGISVGLGPDGELRYPSHHRRSENRGAGEFQCYNRYMLENLKQHAEKHGNPLWGLSGPHDAPGYNQSPMSSGFFSEHGGSWEMPYGDFFLSWYSSQLISHGDRILSMASSTFEDTEIVVSGKVPLMHSWYKTRSHPSELTAGFYNTAIRDGYEAVAEIFSRNSCKIILPGMDLSEEYEPNESRASPELLLAQIASACTKHGVQISGENSLGSVSPRGFEQIKKNLVDQNVVDLFTYQRMGAYFFSPEHFPSYTKFVQSLNQENLHSDDLVTDEEETAVSLPGTNLRMQAA